MNPLICKCAELLYIILVGVATFLSFWRDDAGGYGQKRMWSELQCPRTCSCHMLWDRPGEIIKEFMVSGGLRSPFACCGWHFVENRRRGWLLADLSGFSGFTRLLLYGS